MRPRSLCTFFASRAVPLAFLLAFTPLPALASSPPAGIAQEPTADDLAMVRKQIAQARSALAKLTALEVPQKNRHELDQRIQQADETLSRYEHLAGRGTPRRRTQGVLFAAGAVIVADDVSFIGTVDDALLPILAVGALATLLLTHGPTTVPELGHAWQDVVVAMEAVGQEAERVKRAAARPRVLPARSNCRKHFEKCQETYLGRPNSGSFGKSICDECFDRCQGGKSWPDVLDSKKPCQWWEWIGTAPPGGEPKRSTP